MRERRTYVISALQAKGGLKLGNVATIAPAGPLFALEPHVKERKVSWDNVIPSLQAQSGFKLESAGMKAEMMVATAGPLHHAWMPRVRERKMSLEYVVPSLQDLSGFKLEYARMKAEMTVAPAGPLPHA